MLLKILTQHISFKFCLFHFLAFLSLNPCPCFHHNYTAIQLNHTCRETEGTGSLGNCLLEEWGTQFSAPIGSFNKYPWWGQRGNTGGEHRESSQAGYVEPQLWLMLCLTDAGQYKRTLRWALNF